MESTLQKAAFAAAAVTTITPKVTTRSVFRWIHLVFSIPILGYIYSPFDRIPNYAPATRFVFVPVLVLSGLWLGKGHVVRRLLSKRSAEHDAAAIKTTRTKTGQQFGGMEIQ
jgi:hypothetical protein